MEIFKMIQTDAALNTKVFLHNISCTDEQDIEFENHNVKINIPLTNITDALLLSITTF